MKKSGMIVEIFKNPMFARCSKGGISERCDEVTLLPSADFPDIPELFEPNEKAPAVVIVKRHLFGGQEPYLTAYPADAEGNPDSDMRMAGGAYISCSDSRFPAIYPVPLHDRKE